MTRQRFVKRVISDAALAAEPLDLMPCRGGDIHSSYAVRPSHRARPSLFVKVNSAQFGDVLLSEYNALKAFSKLFNGAYPEPLLLEQDAEHACLVMRYHDLGSISMSSAGELGRLLAQQHSITDDQFGWPHDNHIGLTPQHNGWLAEWPDFYWRRRLQPQLNWAKGNDLPAHEVNQITALRDRLADFFTAYQPQPVLLHGDLWAGNAAFDRERGRALLYDPAPYFGDAETDLAMTRLFGPFAAEFYTGYQSVRSIDEGFATRQPLYNLYHALNHFNLFGSGYLPLVQNQLANLLIAVR